MTERMAFRARIRIIWQKMLKIGLRLLVFVLLLHGWIWFLNLPSRYPITQKPLPTQNALNYFKLASAAINDRTELEYIYVGEGQYNNRAINILHTAYNTPDFHHIRLHTVDRNWIENKIHEEKATLHLHSSTLDELKSPKSVETLLHDQVKALRLIHEGFHYQFVSPSYNRYSEMALALDPCYDILGIQALYQLSVADWHTAAEALVDDVCFNQIIHDHRSSLWNDLNAMRGLGELADDLSPRDLKAIVMRLEKVSRTRLSYSEKIEDERVKKLNMMKDNTEEFNKGRIPTISDRWQVGIPHMFPSPIAERSTILNEYYAWTVPDFLAPKIADRYLSACATVAKLPCSAHAKYPTIPRDIINWSYFGWDERDKEQIRWQLWAFQHDCLMLTLALHGYRQQHAHYPATLKALVTDGWLTRIPQDPFTLSDTICYLNKGKTFTLYSRGPDGIDDGGKPIAVLTKVSREYFEPKPTVDPVVNIYIVRPLSKGDVVYGVNASAEEPPGRL